MKQDSQIFVVVDGVEKAEFDLERVNSTRFNLNLDAKELEIYRSGSGDKEFLEVFPLDFEVAENQSFKQTFELEGGEKVKFQFVPIEDGGVVSKINCGITFVEKEKSFEEKPTPIVAPAAAAATVSAASRVAAETPAPVVLTNKNTVSEKPVKRERNNFFLIPAVALLILLLILSVSWFNFRGINSDQIAKDNSPDKEKNEVGKITKAPAKKEATIKDDEVLPDDISGGGDGDDDVDDKELSDEKTSASSGNSDNKSSIAEAKNQTNSANESSVSTTTTSARKPLIGSTNSVQTVASAGNAGRTQRADNFNARKISRSLSAKNNRTGPRTPINSGRLTDSQNSAINSEISNPTISLASLKNSKRNTRIAKNQNTSSIEKSNVNQSSVEKSGINQGLTDKSLLEIKKVYLKWEGDVDTGILINQKVIEEIKQASLFALMQDKAEADAELKINIQRAENNDSAKNPKVKADMWLVNSFGTILTPTNANRKTLWKYDGSLEKMPGQIVTDVNGLVAEAQKKKANVSEENTANVKTVLPPKTRIKPITDETAVNNKTVKPVTKIDPKDSQVSKTDVDKNAEGKSLLDIKKVYLEWQGDIDTGVKVHQDLVETIQLSGVMNVMREKKDADGVLQINIKKETDKADAKNPKVSADMQLINDKGKTLTPMENGKTAWKYSGKLKKMSKKVIEDINGLVKAEKESNK